MSSKYDAIVVGAGHNGLVTATYLVKAGLSVLVIERRKFVGGACVTEELFPDHYFSSCSYISHLLQGKVVRELELEKHGFKVFRLNPRAFAPFDDGRYIIDWEDHEKTAQEIARLSEHDAKTYPQWIKFWRRAAGIIHTFFLTPPPTLSELFSRAKLTGDEEVLQKVVTLGIKDIADEFFEDDCIKGYFSGNGTDLGDLTAPGSAYCVAHFYCNHFTEPDHYGIVKGGMGSITRAMEGAFLGQGGQIITDTEVSNIIIKEDRALGVRLADGREFTSRVTISNADPKRTFLKLVGEENLDQKFVKSVQGLKTESASLKFHCTLRELPDFSSYLGENFDHRYLAMVRINPRMESRQKSWEDAKNGRATRTPILQCQIPSVHDPTMAPKDHHVMSIWAQYYPARLLEDSWDNVREREGEFLIDTLSNFAPNIKRAIIDWSLLTPIDFERNIYLTDGNIRHLDMTPGQLISQRPHYDTPVLGLYLCGAGTHPGGEVTGAPGHNAAQRILQDLRDGKIPHQP